MQQNTNVHGSPDVRYRSRDNADERIQREAHRTVATDSAILFRSSIVKNVQRLNFLLLYPKLILPI